MAGMRRFGGTALLYLGVLLADTPSRAASWRTQIDYGGSGPSMDLYVPVQRGSAPGVVVLLHYCGGNSAAMHGWLQGQADRHGFLVIAPSVEAGKSCWNATPARSGEGAAIVQMVDYVLTRQRADPERVFVAGASSGACMTNALLAAYPDVFAGGSVLAGVPAGAWVGGSECDACGQAPPRRTAQEWGDIVRHASAAFHGPRPRVQLFHGTSDDTLDYSNLAAEVLQWSHVLGVTQADASTESDQPKRGWDRTSYRRGSQVVLESNSGRGQPHNLTGLGLWPEVVRFFGLDRQPSRSER